MDHHPEYRSPEHERRRGNRFAIHAPAIVRIGNREIWAFTRDVSIHGAYLNVVEEDQFPDVGNVLDLVIKIPPMVGAKACFINGQGKIIRTEQKRWDETGIAVEVLDFAIDHEPGCGFGKHDSTDPEWAAT